MRKEVKELIDKSTEGLYTELESLMRANCALRIKHRLQQTTNYSALRKHRRNIARIKTILRQRAMNGQ
jgi:large subunit ribosomal protein L29